MQSVSTRIWTRVTMSISYDDNQYTTGASIISININYWKTFSLKQLRKNQESEERERWIPPGVTNTVIKMTVQMVVKKSWAKGDLDRGEKRQGQSTKETFLLILFDV